MNGKAEYPGTLIVIEGIDGSGKSTLAQALAAMMQENGRSVVLTKEPGGSNLGKTLRTILHERPVAICPTAEYLLYAADRAQHFQETIIPALTQGATVISDRMADSSLVYQGYGRGLDKTMIANVNQWAMQNIVPDIVIYIKIDPATAASRLKNRETLSVFEKERHDFTNRLIAGFDELFKERSNVITIDGTLSPQEVTQIAYQKVQSWNS